MVKGWVGAAGRGFVGAAPLFEAAPLPANWAYPDEPTTEPLIDQGLISAHSLPTSFNRGAANWAYPVEPTTEPLIDQGPISAHNLPTSKAHGWSTEPFNASSRGLLNRVDKKIRKPWLWP